MGIFDLHTPDTKYHLHLLLLVVTSFLAITLSIGALLSGWLTIFQNIFYLPIIVATVYFGKRGFYYSCILAYIYFILMIVFTHEEEPLAGGLIRVSLFIGMAAVLTGMTIRREKYEIQLQESEERYRHLYKNAIVGLFKTSLEDATVHTCNQKYCDLFGIESPEHAKKFDIRKLYVDPNERLSMARTARKTGKIEDLTIRFRNISTGEEFYGSFSAVYHQDEDVIVGTIIDVTAKIVVEAELKKNKNMLTSVLNTVPQAIFWKDLKGKYLGCNRRFSQSMGYQKPDEIIGRTDDDFPISAQNYEKYKAEDLRVTREKQPIMNIIETSSPDMGRTRWTDYSKLSLIDEKGSVYGVLGICEDITDRMEAEKAIRTREEQYRRIVETASEGIWSMDSQFCTTFINHKMAEMLGYQISEMMGRPIWAFMHPGDLKDNEIRIKNRREGLTERYERRFLKKDGTIVWTLVSATPIPDPDGTFTGSFVMCLDMTISKRAEEERIESERRYRELFNRISDAICVVGMLDSESGIIKEVNDAACSLLKAERTDLIEEPISTFGIDLSSLIIELKNPSYRPNEGNSVERTLVQGENVTILDVKGFKITLHDEPMIFVMMRDITIQKSLETEKNRALQQIQKNLAELSYLNDGIRNPLSIILCYTELHCPDILSVIEDQTNQIDELISSLDKQWMHSEKILSYLKKHYACEIGERSSQ